MSSSRDQNYLAVVQITPSNELWQRSEIFGCYSNYISYSLTKFRYRNARAAENVLDTPCHFSKYISFILFFLNLIPQQSTIPPPGGQSNIYHLPPLNTSLNQQSKGQSSFQLNTARDQGLSEKTSCAEKKYCVLSFCLKERSGKIEVSTWEEQVIGFKSNKKSK